MPKRRAVFLLIGLLAVPAAAQTPASVSLSGTVRDSAGTPLGDVEITVDSSVVLARTDTLGRFVVNDLAQGSHLVRLERPGWVPMRLRVQLRSPVAAGTVAMGEIVLRAAPARVLPVSVAFTDAMSGQAVEGVVVSVGRRVVGYGDRRGRFRSDSVRLLEGEEWSFRRLGYQPLLFELWPAQEQGALDLAIKLKPIAITLGPVVVKGDRSRALTPWLRDFEQRRQSGLGTFLDEEAIQKHRASISATEMLRWADVYVAGDISGLTGRSIEVFGAHCWPPGPPLIYLDGIRLGVASALDWLDMYSPDELLGIEVYNSPAKIPAVFNATGSDCGVIVVWTKR